MDIYCLCYTMKINLMEYLGYLSKLFYLQVVYPSSHQVIPSYLVFVVGVFLTIDTHD